MISEKDIQKKLQELPEHLNKQVVDYIDFLTEKNKKQEISKGKESPKAPFTFEWEDSLPELKQTHTSVDLQHKAMDWR